MTEPTINVLNVQKRSGCFAGCLILSAVIFFAFVVFPILLAFFGPGSG